MRSSAEADFTTVNPATGQTLEGFSFMAAAQIDARLDAAQSAFARWRRHPLSYRTQLLQATARVLRSEQRALAEIAVREMGKPIVQALAEVEKCAWACDYFADRAAEILAEQTIVTQATASSVAFRPLGTIFAIMPWNFPYWQVFRAAAPALVCGNTIILKHAHSTTRCALEIERVFVQAGAPEGLFSTLVVDHDRADAIIADPRIVAVTLTGSERAGRSVAAAAGKALKPSVLELGGSDPFIVLRDADIDLAVDFAVRARFQNTGQSCIAAKRFIVDEPVYDRFVREFARAASERIVGDPLDERTQVGPCAREDLRQTLAGQVTQTVVGGGRIVAGGRALAGPGYFFEPTVVADVARGMPMFDQETFGPAAAVTRARDDAHAIELANDTSFGLGASIWTRDLTHAQRMASEIEAGSVFINGIVTSDPRLPFGGVKQSGYGRELSEFGIREFANIQTLWVGPERSVS